MLDENAYRNSVLAEPNRLVRLPELIALIGVSPSTIWRWERQGSFPSRIQIGARAIGWRLLEVERWLASRQVAFRGEDDRGDAA